MRNACWQPGMHCAAHEGRNRAWETTAWPAGHPRHISMKNCRSSSLACPQCFENVAASDSVAVECQHRARGPTASGGENRLRRGEGLIVRGRSRIVDYPVIFCSIWLLTVARSACVRRTQRGEGACAREGQGEEGRDDWHVLSTAGQPLELSANRHVSSDVRKRD